MNLFTSFIKVSSVLVFIFCLPILVHSQALQSSASQSQPAHALHTVPARNAVNRPANNSKAARHADNPANISTNQSAPVQSAPVQNAPADAVKTTNDPTAASKSLLMAPATSGNTKP